MIRFVAIYYVVCFDTCLNYFYMFFLLQWIKIKWKSMSIKCAMLDTWISRSYLNVSISFITLFARAVLARIYKEEFSSQNRFPLCIWVCVELSLSVDRKHAPHFVQSGYYNEIRKKEQNTFALQTSDALLPTPICRSQQQQ